MRYCPGMWHEGIRNPRKVRTHLPFYRCQSVRTHVNTLYLSTKRYVLLQCMDIPDFDDIITTDSTSTNLHVVRLPPPRFLDLFDRR